MEVATPYRPEAREAVRPVPRTVASGGRAEAEFGSGRAREISSWTPYAYVPQVERGLQAELTACDGIGP